MKRFREKNGSKPKLLSFFPIWKPSLLRKFRSRHLPLATTLLVKAGSTKKELVMDIEAKALCRYFVLRSSSLSLDGRLEQAFLGAI